MVLLGLVAFTLSCSNEKKINEVVEEKETVNSSDQPTATTGQNSEPKEAVLIFPSKAIVSTVEALEEKGDSCKFFFLHQNQTYYIVKAPQGTGIYLNKDSLVLPLQYEKVYNPNMTHDGCIEIKLNGKFGLFHLTSGIVLPPQFEYIAPKTAGDKSLSYGFKDGEFHEITLSNNGFQTMPAEHSLATSLKGLDLQFNSLEKSMLFDLDRYLYDNDGIEGNGTVFLPSYLETLHLGKGAATRLIVKHLTFNYDFGINESEILVKEQSVFGKIASFIVETYEQSWDARSSTSQSASVVTFNDETFERKRLDLIKNHNEAYPTKYKTRFINDNLIEFCIELDEKGNYYDVETVYRYYQIDSTGGIQHLDRPRHFDFTFFAPISAAYFSGFYGMYVPENKEYYFNHLRCQQHLSIKDLDIMRNEIFAEYGFIFKSKEWQEYFSQYDWYEPRFDNVDEQLTDLEKSNIKVILTIRGKMLNNESDFLQVKDSVYHWIP